MKIELKDIKKGMTFFEYDVGMVAELLALEDARPFTRDLDNSGISCLVQILGGEEAIELWESNSASSCCRLKLYTENPCALT